MLEALHRIEAELAELKAGSRSPDAFSARPEARRGNKHRHDRPVSDEHVLDSEHVAGRRHDVSRLGWRRRCHVSDVVERLDVLRI